MDQRSTVEVVLAWQAAANTQDIERLIRLSDPNVEIVGPRGSGYGHQLLRDWLARAGLYLRTRRVFARGGTVVVEQQGTWRAPVTGEVVGEQPVAASFRVANGHVVHVARFDTLAAALADAELGAGDEVHQEPRARSAPSGGPPPRP